MTSIALRLKVEKPFQYSLLLHALLLASGFLMQLWMERQHVTQIPIDLVFLEPPSKKEKIVFPSGATTAIPAPGVISAPKAGQFSSLLAQAKSGINGVRVSGVQKPAPTSNLAALANGLRKQLVANAAETSSKGSVALPGQLKSSTQVKWDAVSMQAELKSLSAVDREAIRKIIAAHESAFRNCHEKALLLDAAFSGQAELLFTAGTGGQVSDTGMNYAGPGSAGAKAALQSCLRAEGQRIKFPASVAGNQVKFTLILR